MSIGETTGIAFWERLPNAIKEAGFFPACVECKWSLLCITRGVGVILDRGTPIGLDVGKIVGIPRIEKVPHRCPIGKVNL